jgi:hypothetical protein
MFQIPWITAFPQAVHETPYLLIDQFALAHWIIAPFAARFSKDLMIPKPLIAPDPDEAKGAHTLEGRLKIIHNVLRPILVSVCRNPLVQEPAWFERIPEFLDRF